MIGTTELVRCPTCDVRALVLRNVFDRVSVGELRERYPERADRLAGMPDDKLVPVARPELACQSCGARFDGSKPVPR